MPVGELVRAHAQFPDDKEVRGPAGGVQRPADKAAIRDASGVPLRPEPAHRDRSAGLADDADSLPQVAAGQVPGARGAECAQQHGESDRAGECVFKRSDQHDLLVLEDVGLGAHHHGHPQRQQAQP